MILNSEKSHVKKAYFERYALMTAYFERYALM